MSVDRDQRIADLFHRAVVLPAADRAAFVHAACDGDAALVEEIGSLLAADAAAGSFIDTPALAQAAAELANQTAVESRDVAPPTVIGPYTVVALLGRGGMGEVYRGRDPRLGRDVALKILPDRLALDAERRSRFEREARILASLNHPHIAALYGIEEVGHRQALVMELVDGSTLEDRIGLGPLPVTEILTIAAQIASALEAAHEQGIIHRDVKPQNVIIRRDGTVKVLDFGLAKALEPIDGAYGTTITAPAGGNIVGTAAYMSPEQARGAVVDRQTDVWAFGCMLYEMLTRRKAFAGESVSDIIARIIEREPDFDALPPGTPPGIRVLVQRCLEKNPRKRLRHIGDALLEIEAPRSAQAAIVTTRPAGRARGVGMGLVAGIALAGAMTWWLGFGSAPTARPVSRFALAFPSSSPAVVTLGPTVAISPDGSRTVVRSANGAWMIRRSDQLEFKMLGGDGLGINQPFFSPDSKWLGFVQTLGADRAVLKKIPVGGGAAVPITSEGMSFFRGATWSPDGTIVFAAGPGLFRVPSTGGRPARLAISDHPDTQVFAWPEFLPNGRWLLFTETGGGTVLPGRTSDGTTIALDVQSGERRTVIQGASHARYLASGHLIYTSAGTLYGVPFDASTLAPRGEPVALIRDVRQDDFRTSSEGTLIYVSGYDANRELVWVDRSGREQPTGSPPKQYVYPRLSPDETKVAVDVDAANRDVMVWDLESRTLTPLTVDPAENLMPVWSPDGQRIAYGRRTDVSRVYWQRADRTDAPALLTESTVSQMPLAFAPDGSRLLLFVAPGNISSLVLDGAHRPEPVLAGEANETGAELSPDAHFMAYVSNETGTPEIYVRPFPDDKGRKWTVSRDGGSQPLWSRKRPELYYRNRAGALMAVPVTMEPEFVPGPPVKLFDSPTSVGAAGGVRAYDAVADGSRFLMVKLPQNHVIVVENWFAEVARLAPTK